MWRTTLFTLVLMAGLRSYAQQTNSLGMHMVPIAPGTFNMGSSRTGEDADENPVHAVTITRGFLMSATEITNKQYEAFDPAHALLRGKGGFSFQDDEAVVFVGYDDAVAFCQWLSRKEGKNYRLPTEAEWEYACRAGTTTDYHTGNELPAMYQKQQRNNRVPASVSLQVGRTLPNPWGLYDMHGNVEEWVCDWYGAYTPGAQNDPVGLRDGTCRVTRGGSHNTVISYLRSASRHGMLPKDKHWHTGFRIIQAGLLETQPLPVEPPGAHSQNVSLVKAVWEKKEEPLFAAPIPFVLPPANNDSSFFFKHNHCPALTWCTNGDLLAAWFSTNAEAGREMTILASRLRAGAAGWDTASVFLKIPDRNLTGTSLLQDAHGTLFHINGVAAAGEWQNLAMIMRTSKNNGATWTKPVLIAPNHSKGHQVIAGSFITKEGWMVQACDADPGPRGGTALYISKDRGQSWMPYTSSAFTPIYQNGKSGGLIAGIHAGVVQCKDGSLLALGRNDNIMAPDNSGERMPMSISYDTGKTWQYQASEFPPISSGQRLVLRRLNEGALLLISFTHAPGKSAAEGMLFTGKNGGTFKGYGMYAALSYDDGKTWPVKKLITDGVTRTLQGGAWTGSFTMDASHAEPKGYLAATQTPDNMIHLVSSSLYYRFNLAWLQQ